MKRAKQNPFLKRQHDCFNLWLDVQVESADVPDQADFYRWAWQALKNDYRFADISIVLCSEDEARRFNRDYRGRDYATNVLSFTVATEELAFADPQGGLYGDLVMCPAVIAKEAAEQGKSLLHHYAHLSIHGVLHLMGYDHEADDEAWLMEAREIGILRQLGYANPYEDKD